MALTTESKIADYFIYVANETGSYLSNLKLQKLLYYAQAWHLALYGISLFDEEFEAWIHGPVIPSLYAKYQKFGWKPILEEVNKPEFSEELQEFLDEVTEEYFMLDTFELEMMTHREAPWIEARKGLPIDEPSRAIISLQSMKDYFKARVTP
ncbi:MAG: type II toxin-antitoxin system antitoxin SocA domain-containing protein [Pseudomonadota bacterium]